MNIQSISPNYLNKNQIYNINFQSASDITLEYVYKKHSKYLPETMKIKIKELLSSGQKRLPKLYELHAEVYKNLFEAKSLEEVRLYPEFRYVKDIKILENNRSKAVKAVRNQMPLENFTLEYLKKIYTPETQENIVKHYGFTNRSLLLWLNEKLGIQKLDGNYIQLLKMSNEEENSRIAELSRRAIYANPEAQKLRQEKVAAHHRTPEYRAKKRQEMIEFYQRNPEMAMNTRRISQLTWDKCPEVKDAMKAYTLSLSSYQRAVLSKKRQGEPLSENEKRAISGYYKNFWNQNEECKRLIRERRLEAIEELKNENL